MPGKDEKMNYSEKTENMKEVSAENLPAATNQESTTQEGFEFFNERIRYVWDQQKEEFYFSVVDVIGVLTESADPKQYIKKMRTRDEVLNANWGTICTPVPMISKDGKLRRIQAATVEGLLRIIQSVPSPKAEPIKLWLAQVGRERIEEMIDPEMPAGNWKKHLGRVSFHPAMPMI